MCVKNQIIKLAIKINVAALITKLLSCKPTLLKITKKSGFLQLTASTKKNDLDFLNIVFENVKPMNKAIIPLMNNKKATYIQLNEILNIVVQIVENTIVLELHEINGATIKEIMCSFLELELLVINIDVTLHPKPVSRLTTLLPLNPNLLKARSRRIEILDIIPIC